MDAREAAPDPSDRAMGSERSGRHSTLPVHLSSFVGREREMSTLDGLLQLSRIVTLTGVGGAGKTRLALEVGSHKAADFRHGAVLVDLAPLSDPADIAQAIVQALGVADVTGRSAAEALEVALVEREVLVLLDNCEHLAGACAAVVETMLKATLDVRVLATSREPLDVEGEVTVLVPPLAVPPAGKAHTGGATAQFDAVRLFSERAAAARPDFVVEDANADAVARICQRLDGLPLAIELAAAWVRSMSAEEILERLDDRFTLLTRSTRRGPPRHRTLRATLDWSHDLLSEAEGTLFRRLAVFQGGWTLSDVERICSAGVLRAKGMVELHASLVDRSLVVADTWGGVPTRYRFLETVRLYAADLAAQAGEVDPLRRRHFEHFLSVAESYCESRTAGGSDATLTGLAAHRDNFRAALVWASEVDRELAMRLTAALDDFWRMISAAEGWRWLQRTLVGAAVDSPFRIRALITAGMLSAYIPAYAEGAGLLREASSLAGRVGDRRSQAWAELWLGRISFFAGEPQAAEAQLRRALAAHEELGEALGLVRALCLLGLFEALVLNHPGEGGEKLERALRLAQEVGDGWGAGYAQMMLGLCAADVGDSERAERLSRAALLAPALGPLLGVPLLGLAWVAVEGDPIRAMRLLGAAAGHFQRTGTVAPPFLQRRSEAIRERGAQLLGVEPAARAMTDGRAMNTEEAVAYAQADQAGQRWSPAGGLTPREAQVAALVARGRTNRELGVALHISVRTAESHLDHILSKLDLRNRTELAAWARDNLAEHAALPAPDAGNR